MIDIRFEIVPPAHHDTAVVAVYEDNVLSAAASELNRENGSIFTSYLEKQSAFQGKSGQTLVIPAGKDSPYHHFMLWGLGKSEQPDSDALETAGGKLSLALKALKSRTVCLFAPDAPAKAEGHHMEWSEIVCRTLSGLQLRSYEFKKYKTPKDDDDDQALLETVTVISAKDTELAATFESHNAVCEGVFWARNLVNEPPNVLYPESFAQMIKDDLKPLGVEVEIFDEKKMEKLGFHAHLAVGKGSERQPRAVIMRWNGTDNKDKEADKPLAFVGKGVTFDTGGISIKPSAGMEDMKLDMGGAATVVGLMKTLALRKANVDVVGIVGLAENMPSRNAYRPSDIIDSLSGKTIEVLNTDAEGRLVLADCLSYVQNTYDPRLVVDLATLTGAMMVALGCEYCGTFVNDDDFWAKLEAASSESNEKLWRMPLDKAYKKEMESSVADLRNMGNGRFAGACTAAGFLEHFVDEDRVWAHMDIAGTAWISKDSAICPKPGTGFGVRVLNTLIARFYE